jgi:hypothetical protein
MEIESAGWGEVEGRLNTFVQIGRLLSMVLSASVTSGKDWRALCLYDVCVLSHMRERPALSTF